MIGQEVSSRPPSFPAKNGRETANYRSNCRSSPLRPIKAANPPLATQLPGMLRLVIASRIAIDPDPGIVIIESHRGIGACGHACGQSALDAAPNAASFAVIDGLRQ